MTMIAALGNAAGSSYMYADATAQPGVDHAYRIVVVEAGSVESIKGPYRRVARQDVAMMIPQQTEVRWQSNAGDSYSLQRSPTLVNPAWTTIATGEVATPPENVFVDGAAGDERQYYRVVVE